MVDLTPLIATAQRLITENGRAVTLVQFNTTPSNSDKPWLGPADPRSSPDSTLAVDAVFVNPGETFSLGASFKVSDLMKRSEQIMLVSPGASADMSLYNEVIDTDGSKWKIDQIEVLKPGTSVALVYVGVSR